MNYNILTASDSVYFPFLKILINSIIKKCDLSKINSIFIINNGLNGGQIKYLKSKLDKIKFISTDNKTSERTSKNWVPWSDDWQTNVKSKTIYLHKLTEELNEPIVLLDSDMIVVSDLFELTLMGGDVQVCYRPGLSLTGSMAPCIASYFFCINPKNALPFIKKWRDLTQHNFNINKHGAHESRSLSIIESENTDKINIKRLPHRNIVNAQTPKDLLENTALIHFKGFDPTRNPSDNIEKSIHSHIFDYGWEEYIKTNKYTE